MRQCKICGKDSIVSGKLSGNKGTLVVYQCENNHREEVYRKWEGEPVKCIRCGNLYQDEINADIIMDYGHCLGCEEQIGEAMSERQNEGEEENEM